MLAFKLAKKRFSIPPFSVVGRSTPDAAWPARWIELENTQRPTNNRGRMPVLFVGHGSPMNAIEDNVWSRGFKALGAAMPAPRAVRWA